MSGSAGPGCSLQVCIDAKSQLYFIALSTAEGSSRQVDIEVEDNGDDKQNKTKKQNTKTSTCIYKEYLFKSKQTTIHVRQIQVSLNINILNFIIAIQDENRFCVMMKVVESYY